MVVEISPQHLNLLVEEVLVQADLALRSFDDFQKLINDPETRQRRECWSHIQSLLSHAAMISKYLAPPRQTDISEARAASLRAALEIQDGSAVLLRNARNNIEHLDERLDRWMASDVNKLLECVFINRSGYEYLNRKDADGQQRWFVKRAYLVEEGVFISEGRAAIQEIAVLPLIEELSRIQRTAADFLSEDGSIIRVYPEET